MIPQAQTALDLLADKIMTGLSPVISNEYAVIDSLLIAGLMKCLAQDFDRAAQVRMDDLSAMQVLFTDSLGVIKQEALRSELQHYIGQQSTPDLSVSALTKAHASASELLIKLHCEVERLCPQPNASDLNQAIWAYLGAHVQRHQYDVALG